MTHRKMIGLTTMAAGLCLTSHTQAFESTCRPQGTAYNTMEQSICAPYNAKECAEGVEFPRGQQLGEHAYIALQGLVWAGIPSALILDQAAVEYYVDGPTALPGTGPVSDPTSVLSIAPTGTGNLSVLVGPNSTNSRLQRPMTIAQFAHVPDGSYSVSDFLLGNEHCLAANAFSSNPATHKNDWRDSLDAINDCHKFVSHMGPVNSTHFSPQNRSMYNLYHGVALKIAARCTAMLAAAQTSPPQAAGSAATGDELSREILICQKESLAFQGAAAHFLGDAWSTGHMWQRWGSPEFAKDEQGRLRAIVVAATSGIIHGWRHLALLLAGPLDNFNLGDWQHDQLCMPGRFNSNDPNEPIVQWRNSNDPTAHPGGGDDYLLTCEARNMDPEGALQSSKALGFQYNRMLTCMMTGFGEVYDQGPGPNLPWQGPRPTMAPPGMDTMITTSTQDECWDQRVTNESMELGSGVSRWVELSDPGVLVNLELDTTNGLLQIFDGLGLHTQIAGISAQLRIDLGKFAFVKQRAQAQRDQTDVAELGNGPTDPGHEGPLGVFLGTHRNSFYRSLIDSPDLAQRAEYLEQPDPASWSAKAGSSCTHDSDCNEELGYYCDHTTVVGGAVGSSCLRHEAAVLRAFRLGETPYWCTADGLDELNAARARVGTAQCGPAFPGSAAVCEACARVVLPHVRNACDAASYHPTTLDGVDRRSVCDIYKAQGGLVDETDRTVDATSVYLAYDPDDPDGAHQAALAACGSGVDFKPAASSPPPAPPPLLSDVCYRSCDSCLWCLNGYGHLYPVGGSGSFVALGEANGQLCAVDGAGAAWCWTSLTSTGPPATPPTLVPGVANAVAITGSPNHGCVLTTGGQVKCWGAAGLLGDGTGNASATPVPVQGLVGITGISASGSVDAVRDHTCALRNDGTVWCWGGDLVGQCGDSTQPSSSVLAPIQVQGFDLVSQTWKPVTGFDSAAGASGIATGWDHSCGLKTDGTVWCWGSNNGGQLGNNQPPNGYWGAEQVLGYSGGAQVVAGGAWSCARAGTAVSCWGIYDYVTMPNAGAIPTFANVEAISGSDSSNLLCARRTDHSVVCLPRGLGFMGAPAPVLPACP